MAQAMVEQRSRGHSERSAGVLTMVCHRGAKIPVARSPGPLNFVVVPNTRGGSAWNLMQVTLLVPRSFMSPFWCLEVSRHPSGV